VVVRPLQAFIFEYVLGEKEEVLCEVRYHDINHINETIIEVDRPSASTDV
jgi:hypothetical protein